MDFKKCLDNLKRNHFQVKLFQKREELILSLIGELRSATSISRGGSMTVEDLGILERIKKEGLPFRDYAGAEDKLASITAEYYITGSNAITEDGQVVNIDGRGNRVAALSYGPQKVFIIAGTNKIVPDVKAGIDRIHNVAAPLNCRRLERNTPCAKTGKCTDCDTSDRICNITSIITKSAPGRISIYLLDEALGF